MLLELTAEIFWKKNIQVVQFGEANKRTGIYSEHLWEEKDEVRYLTGPSKKLYL